MKNIERLINDPPLRAVRAFEAFARVGSVTAAAVELDITPSAVSHQLQLLETFVQTPLTIREGRTLALTDEGRDYYRSISAAFSVLRSATGFVRDRSSLRQITISLIPLFGIGCFIPRLHAFLADNQDVDVTVLYAHHRNYLSDASDLSIRFGVGDWRGYRCERLLSGAVVPVCSPAFARRHGPFRRPADLAAAPLVHDENRNTWVNWFQDAGVKHVTHAVGPLFEDGQLTLAATRAGLGAALLRAPLIERELMNGELVKLFDHALDDGRDYYLCSRADADLPDGAQRLADWLRKTMGARKAM
ncbi:LysR substrate-binding domain-containing protein [Burkholderia oklahomensis]|uniref:LysR substrate-binding domain-containing protein n=1 Tax=Burkholderia oklahomensis TaxID=342113 RepID=UPI00016A9451|nr:LysR substrate-binding domain-containing protein [Burkholderia oklahomensis]AJX34985.1 bacterial regulatory helix-turn-helix, lysR family protein [Burkholderia oklahomensis C6786]AOI49201.1 LysR family transcriptional regulator [Burkholderia oklahomensis C6786]KUY60750.1 LysR family transcriptional regulator [Burkholderia oklahomensis C6786]MBI0362560.1 LysR family transcriptional regulator [Burkholderia oklahomensis]SUY26665.1 Gcv operon activator [Burkholderia oklahomensis]